MQLWRKPICLYFLVVSKIKVLWNTYMCTPNTGSYRRHSGYQAVERLASSRISFSGGWGIGAQQRISPKWEESAQKEGGRGNMEEWLSV